jgi:hypothetical protein
MGVLLFVLLKLETLRSNLNRENYFEYFTSEFLLGVYLSNGT